MSLYMMTPYGRKMIRRHMLNRLFDEGWQDEYNQVAFPVDVKVEDEAFVISAMLPGVTSENLTIQIVNDTVSIQGDILDNSDPNARYLKQEMPSGHFARVLHLPDHLDSTKAEAELENGILTLRLPKAEESRPKTIKITAR